MNVSRLETRGWPSSLLNFEDLLGHLFGRRRSYSCANDVGKNMRGADVMQEGLFSFKRLEEFVPPDHPLRGIRTILNAALARLDAKFDEMYSPIGRDSIAPDWVA